MEQGAVRIGGVAAKRVRAVLYPELGSYFEELRLTRRPGVSQQHAARLAADKGIDLKYQALRGLERGETKFPDPETLSAMAEFYEISYAELVARVVATVYRLPSVSSADTGIVLQHSPSQKGGADVLHVAEAGVFEGWRADLLPEILEAAGHFADLIVESREIVDKAARPGRRKAKRSARNRTAR